ncbi:MAG TPA: MFS transporter [Acidobacteriaceae bacterium]|nr:MFS transporter [Acidobacteriaceae bacterium]
MELIAGRAPLESALRKAQWRIIPLLALCYLVAYMDRANISFAAESMNRDLHFSAKVYGLGAGLFFISYALCEIPSNRLLLRFGARRWLARIMLTWGAVAVGMSFVHSSRTFYATRLLLGVAEAGYFPGALYCMSLWFPSARRARAISWFYISLPLSIAVMGAIAGTLLRLDGRLGLHGWQWLFLIEGLPAVVLGVCIWFILPDSPGSARWLNAAERSAVAAELASNQTGTHASPRTQLLWRVLRTPRVWVLGLFAVCIYAPIYGLSFFLPQLVANATKLPAQSAGFLIALAGVLGAPAMLLGAAHSDRSGDRRWHIMVPSGLIAPLMIIAAIDLRNVTAAVALLLTTVLYMAMQGPWMTVVTEACDGEAAALAIATINMCGILGGFIGPYWMGWMREWMGSYAVGLGAMSVSWIVAVGCIAWATRSSPKATMLEQPITVELVAATEKSL